MRDAWVSVSGTLMGVMCMGECEWCRSESVSVVRVSVGECVHGECEWSIGEYEVHE